MEGGVLDGRGGLVALERIVVVEAGILDQMVDEGAATAAEGVVGIGRTEKGVAMLTGSLAGDRGFR